MPARIGATQWSVFEVLFSASHRSAWSWPRLRYPAVHRWGGRVYVATALPAALLTLPLVLLNNDWAGDVGAAATGGTWFVTTLVGYVAMRKGDEPRHRRWML